MAPIVFLLFSLSVAFRAMRLSEFDEAFTSNHLKGDVVERSTEEVHDSNSTARNSEDWWIQSAAAGKHSGSNVFVGTPPVHETIMYKAIQGANSRVRVDEKYLMEGPDLGPPSAELSDFIRGSIWNDDPLSLLFQSGHRYAKSTGIVFANRMEGLVSSSMSECRGGQGDWRSTVTWPNHIMCHSHYGNLQFLHGMGNADGDSPHATREKIMAYAEWAYKMAIGDRKVLMNKTSSAQYPTDQKIVDSFRVLDSQTESILYQSFAEAVPEDRLGTLTVKHLYTNHAGDEARVLRKAGEVAIGSLVHLISDSYAVGHTGRETGVEELGPITQFRGYVEQDHKLHSDYDMFPWQNIVGSNRNDCGERQYMGKMLGYNTAIMYATELMRFYFTSTRGGDRIEWNEGPQQLFEDVFRLSTKAVPAGSGQITYEFSGTKLDRCQICFYSSAEYTGTPQCLKAKAPCTGSYTEADFGCLDERSRMFKTVGAKGQLHVQYNSQICNGGSRATKTFTL